MIVTCPRCLTKFNFSDEYRIAGVEINFRCSRCRQEFVFTPEEDSVDLADIISSLSEPVAAESAAGESRDVSAEAAEIELDEHFTPFAARPADDAAPTETELELDLDELFPAEDDILRSESPAESLDGGKVSEVDFVDAAPETALETAPQTEVEVSAEPEIDEPSPDPDVIDGDDNEAVGKDDGSADPATDGKIEEHLPEDEPETVTEVEAEPEAAPKSLSSDPPPVEVEKGTSNPFLLFIGAVLILGLALWAGYSMWQQYALDMGRYLQLVEVSNQRLHLASDRNLIVLKGKIVNSSPKMVTDLKIKGVLLDGNGKTVAEEVTTGGAVYSQDELYRMDRGTLAQLEKNGVSRLPAGGELPFMVVFYECPDDAGKCYAEISSFQVK